jgi:pimeloyl-ACP methyl ester carboxylesterase
MWPKILTQRTGQPVVTCEVIDAARRLVHRQRMPFIETSDGTNLFYTDWGCGPAVVFTHAWALSSDQWTYQMPAFVDAGLRCVAYDRRGHGRSDRPGRGYELDTLADDLAQLIQRLDLRDVTLIGHSLGTREIVRYLTRYGQSRVGRLVLVAPTTPFLLRTDDNPDGWDASLVAANRAALQANVPKWCADSNAVGPYFGTTAGDVQGLVDWTIRQIVDTPLHVLLQTASQNIVVDMRAELPTLSLPCLILHGDADASAPIELTGRKTVSLIPGARLIEYAGAGHGLYASEHQRLNADALAFIGSGALVG